MVVPRDLEEEQQEAVGNAGCIQSQDQLHVPKGNSGVGHDLS